MRGRSVFVMGCISLFYVIVGTIHRSQRPFTVMPRWNFPAPPGDRALFKRIGAPAEQNAALGGGKRR